MFVTEQNKKAGPVTHFANAYGVCVETCLPAGLAGFASAQGREAGMRIVRRAGLSVEERQIVLAAQASNSGASNWTVPLEAGSMCLVWDDGLELLVRDAGRLVEVNHPQPDRLDRMSSFIFNFAVSGALLLQGEETLHGTAVDVGGVGVGLIAPCGAGKSTLASCLISLGARLISDDLMRLAFRNEAVLLHRGPGCIKLFRDAWQAYLPDFPSVGLFHLDGEKELIQVPPAWCAEHLSALHTLLFLDGSRDGPDSPVIEEVSGLEKFGLLAASSTDKTYEARCRLEKHFAFVKSVAARLPLHRLRYRNSPDTVSGVARVIREHAAGSRP